MQATISAHRTCHNCPRRDIYVFDLVLQAEHLTAQRMATLTSEHGPDHVLGIAKLRGRAAKAATEPGETYQSPVYLNSVSDDLNFANPINTGLPRRDSSDDGDLHENSDAKSDGVKSENDDPDNEAEEHHMIDALMDFFGGNEFVMEGKALGFIGITNPVRKAIFMLLHNPLFDFFILICILINCVILYFQVPGVKNSHSESFNSAGALIGVQQLYT